MFTPREREVEPPARRAPRKTSAPPKAAAPRKAAVPRKAAAPTIYKHAGCSIKHRTLEAASTCRNR